MRYVTSGRSRFTGSWLELELEAASLEEALARATRLGLEEVTVQPIESPDASTVRDDEDTESPDNEAEGAPSRPYQ